MKKLLFLIAFVACGATAQSVTATFENAPEGQNVKWADGPFLKYKDAKAEGTVEIATQDGFVEVVFMNETVTRAKFLLREGDKVNIGFDETGYPTVTNPADPSFDAVYNFPASIPGMPLASPDDLTYDKRRIQMGMPPKANMTAAFEEYLARFTAAVDAADMPDEYRKYYKEAYFGTGGDPVFDDSLVRYYSINERLVTYMDGVAFGCRRATQGKTGPEFDKLMTEKYDEIAADTNIPPLTKMVMLRLLLGKMAATIDVKLEIEYLGKYKELIGDDLSEKYAPYTGPQPEVDVTMENSAGETFSLADIIASNAGKVVFVDFWASWCGPCMQSMPVSKRLREIYPEIVFIYISIDEDRAAWVATEERLGLHDSYRVMDRKASSFITNSLGGLRGVPRYLLFGRDGTMLFDRTPIPSGSLGMLFEQY